MNTSRDLLVSRTVRVLPADRVILQVPLAPASDVDLVDACDELDAAGYRLAATVDDATPLSPMLDAAHVIRVDVSGFAPGALPELSERLRAYPARLLATNVSHRGERDRCGALGFDLFEGYRFSAPESCLVARSPSSICTRFAFSSSCAIRAPTTEIEALIGATWASRTSCFAW